MTTPAGGGRPAGFSSPMGGFSARSAAGAAATALAAMAASAALYRRHMEAGAKAAEKATAEAKKQQDIARRTPGGGGTPAGGGSTSTTRGGSANGGGAVIPAAPSSAAFSGPATAKFSGIPAPVPNGGGARFGGLAGRAGGVAGGVVGAAVGIGAAGLIGGVAAASSAFPNMVQTDFAANRLAMTNQRYNKQGTANRMLGYTAGAYINDTDRVAGLMRLRNGGFTENSASFSTQARGARTIGRMDPTMGYDRAAAVQTGFQDATLFNTTRMLTGVETIGPGGAPRSIGEIARGLAKSGGWGSTVPTAKGLAADLGPNGGLTIQMRTAGMSQDMQDSVGNYFRTAVDTGSYAAADKQLGREGNTVKGNNADTALQKMNTQTSAEQEVITSLLKPTIDSFNTIMKTLTKATEETAGLFNDMPEAARKAIGAMIAIGGVTSGEIGGGNVSTAIAAGVGSAAGNMLRRGVRTGGGPAASRAARLASRGGAGLVGGLVGEGAEALFGSDDPDSWRNSALARRLGRTAAGAGAGAGIGAAFGGVGAVPGALLGAAGGFFGLGMGDGYGRRKEPSFGMAGWGGISRPEIGDGPGEQGDSNKSSSGRGGQTYQWLKRLMAQSGLPHRIVSEVRPNARTTSGGVSYHASGNAIDIAGPKPGKDTREMLAINQYLARKLGKGAKELIYSGPGATNLNNGKSHTYSGTVRGMHHDHVHVAVTDASLKMAGVAADQAGGPSLRDENEHTNRPGAPRKTRRKGSRLRRGRQGRGAGSFSERGLVESFFGNVSADDRFSTGSGADMSEKTASAAANEAAKAASGSAGPDAIEKFLYGLRMHESGGDYTAENPRSSASGAYQYLSGTWGKYRGYKTAGSAPATVQDERARNDASRRYREYGDWRKVAVAHFQGEGFLKKNPDPASWDGRGDRSAGNPKVSSFVKSVLTQGGLPETGDGPGASVGMGAHAPMADGVLAEVPRPRPPQSGRGGGPGVQVDARRGGSISIAKVEVHLTTPQVSPREAERIGKMIAADIARQARQSEMSL